MTADAQALLQSWRAPWGVDLALSLAIVSYLRGWFPLRTIFPRLIPGWQCAAFLAGIASVWLAIGSPIEAFDDVSLTIHMVQHLLLMAIAPPLILLGAPALPLLRGLPQWAAHNVVSPILRWNVVKSAGRFAANPAICWSAAALALIAWHIPTLFELALRWDWLHEFEHASFFGAGLLFWWPVVQPWPSIARWPRWCIPLYLFCATLPCDALSGFLAFCDRVVYPSYLSSSRLFYISPLQDQERAAVLMWVAVTIIFLLPAVIVTMQILSPSRVHLAGDGRDHLSRPSGEALHTPKLEIS
jgi:putative membrane protein